MEKKSFEISIYTENHIGLLSNITNFFSRRSLNLEVVEANQTYITDVSRIGVITWATYEEISHVIKHIEKHVDVMKVFFYEGHAKLNEEIKIVHSFIEERENDRLKGRN